MRQSFFVIALFVSTAFAQTQISRGKNSPNIANAGDVQIQEHPTPLPVPTVDPTGKVPGSSSQLTSQEQSDVYRMQRDIMVQQVSIAQWQQDIKTAQEQTLPNMNRALQMKVQQLKTEHKIPAEDGFNMDTATFEKGASQVPAPVQQTPAPPFIPGQKNSHPKVPAPPQK